jgi:hypothetical protein
MAEPRAEDRDLIPRDPDQESVLLDAIPEFARSAAEQDLVTGILSEGKRDPALPG